MQQLALPVKDNTKNKLDDIINLMEPNGTSLESLYFGIEELHSQLYVLGLQLTGVPKTRGK